MNKKDLRKYIDKQEKEVPKNNPFADLRIPFTKAFGFICIR